jgi:hypothetical protein
LNPSPTNIGNAAARTRPFARARYDFVRRLVALMAFEPFEDLVRWLGAKIFGKCATTKRRLVAEASRAQDGSEPSSTSMQGFQGDEKMCRFNSSKQAPLPKGTCPQAPFFRLHQKH